MKKLFVLLTVVTSFLAIETQANMGFYHPDQFPIGTPSAISRAVPSVFKVWAPGGSVKMRLNNWTQEEWQKAFDAADQKKDYLTTSQLNFCQREQLRPCLIFDDITSASGFLMLRGDLLWTNRHVFLEMLTPWVQAWKETHPEATPEQEATFALNFPTAILVYDQNNKKLTTISAHKGFKYLHYGPLANRLSDPEFIQTFSTDIVVIQLPAVIGEPLPLAKTPSQIGDIQYILGFPVQTFNRHEQFGTPDSTGMSRQHMSFGAKIGLDESLFRLGKMNSPVRDAKAKLDQDPILKQTWNSVINFTEGDCEAGNSGGPVLNDKGEVVAIFSARLAEYRGTNPSLMFGLAIDLTSIPQNPDFNF